VKTILSKGPGAVKVVTQLQLLPYADTPAPGWLFQTPGDVVDPDGPPQTPGGITTFPAGTGVKEAEAVEENEPEGDCVRVTLFVGEGEIVGEGVKEKVNPAERVGVTVVVTVVVPVPEGGEMNSTLAIIPFKTTLPSVHQ